MMALLSAAMAGISAGGAYMFAAWSVSSLMASHLVDKVTWLKCMMSYAAGLPFLRALTWAAAV